MGEHVVPTQGTQRPHVVGVGVEAIVDVAALVDGDVEVLDAQFVGVRGPAGRDQQMAADQLAALRALATQAG